MKGETVAGIFYSRYGPVSDMDIDSQAANYIAEVITHNKIPITEAVYLARRLLDAAVQVSDKKIVTEHDVVEALASPEFDYLM